MTALVDRDSNFDFLIRLVSSTLTSISVEVSVIFFLPFTYLINLYNNLKTSFSHVINEFVRFLTSVKCGNKRDSALISWLEKKSALQHRFYIPFLWVLIEHYL